MTQDNAFLKVGSIKIRRVVCASGARGFVGEGYRFHEPWKPYGLDYRGSTFITKTLTLLPRKGNLPLDHDGITPRDMFPKCIIVKPLEGVVLNAISLSNPGAEAIFKMGALQKLDEPFVVSFALMGETREERIVEWRTLLGLVFKYLFNARSRFAIELNVSCANVEHGYQAVYEELRQLLDIIEPLNIPLIVKISALMPVREAKRVSEHPACSALSVSNALKWGSFPKEIDWAKIFGPPYRAQHTHTSPLAEFGGGALSGWPLRQIVIDWIADAYYNARITKPIIAGGGVLSHDDAQAMIDAGADAISLGVISILRPWRVAGIIRRVNEFMEQRSEHEESTAGSN